MSFYAFVNCSFLVFIFFLVYIFSLEAIIMFISNSDLKILFVFLFFRFKDISYVCIYLYVCAPCTCLISSEIRRLELWMGVSYDVGARN